MKGYSDMTRYLEAVVDAISHDDTLFLGYAPRMVRVARLMARLADKPMTVESELKSSTLALKSSECHAIATLVQRGHYDVNLERMLCTESHNLRLLAIILVGRNSVEGYEAYLHNIACGGDDSTVVAEALRVLLTNCVLLDVEAMIRAIRSLDCNLRRWLLREVAIERGCCEPILASCDHEDACSGAWLANLYKYILR